MFYQWMYKKCYLRTLLLLAYLLRIAKKPKLIDKSEVIQLKNSIFDDADKHATLLGDAYRGIGVTVSLIGLLIIFFAIAPVAFEVNHQFGRVFAACEMVLMILMLFLVTHTTKKNHRKKWIDARKEVEGQRYDDLKKEIQQLQHANENKNNAKREVSMTTLNQKLNIIFEEQISYNKDKAAIYVGVEKCSDMISWVGFLLAFTAAFLHLFINESILPFHESILLFFTAFVPALVGAIHGTNAFLRLSDLAEEHAEMAENLEAAKLNLNHVENDPKKILEIAEMSYNMLSDRDIQWAVSANKLGLKLV